MELQPGDACEECLGQGLHHKLRYFYINLEEQILKCESRSCLWPHNDEVSSDEEKQEERVESQSIPTTDDDDFIMQLLQELGPSEELPGTEANEDTDLPAETSVAEQFSMPDLTDFGLADLATSCENFLSIEPQPADSTKISASATPSPAAASASAAPQSPPPKLLSNFKACDKTLSMPATNTTKATAENATYAQPEAAPSINFIISMPDLGQQLKKEVDLKPAISPALKPQLFQLPPCKASTLPTKKQPTSPKAPPPKSPEMPPPSSTTSSFLDALRRQPVRPIRSPPQRLPRKRRTAAGAVPRSGPPPTQLVMQFLGRLEADRQKEVKTEGEEEVKKEAQ